VYYFRLPDDTIELFGYVKTKVHWREHPDIPELKLAQYSIKPKLFNHKGKIYYARRSRVKSFTWGIGKLSVRGIGNQQTTASEISLKKIILSKKAKDTTNVKIHSDNVYTTDGVVYAFGVRVGFFHDNEAVIMNPAIRKLLSQGGEWKIRAL
jgi:hypothetical protein